MAKWISGISIHTPIPTLQKLFTSPTSKTPQLRGHPQEKAHHPKSHSQPVPQRACPQPNPPDSAKLFTPRPTQDKPGCSGIGPERALDRSTPFPQRGSAKPHLPYDPCECRPCPAEPPPRRSTPPKVPFSTRSPKSLSPTKPSRLCKTLHTTPHPRQTGLQRDRAGASIGSKHPIPTARQREAPPPVRSLRVQALSRGVHPRSAPPC